MKYIMSTDIEKYFKWTIIATKHSQKVQAPFTIQGETYS